MQIRNLPSYDFTRLEMFEKELNLTGVQKVELHLILEDMVNHFFENVDQAVEIAVINKVAQLQGVELNG